jgi:hypothetical protein
MLQAPFTHDTYLQDFCLLINQEEYKKVIDEIDASVVKKSAFYLLVILISYFRLSVLRCKI